MYSNTSQIKQVISFLLSVWLMSLTVVAFGQQPCPQGFRAYLFVGNASGALGYNQRVSVTSANQAQSDFQNAGYTVVRNDNATRQDVVNALNDPCARAMWFFGHGKYNSTTGILGKQKLTNPVEQINMTDGSITGDPALADGATLVPANNRLNQVTVHACGQDLPSWRNRFMNSNFSGWSTTVRAWQIWWWQFFATYPVINPNTGNEMSVQPPPIPIIHPSLEQVSQFVFEEDASKFICDCDNVANNCTLQEPLKSQFGDQIFNFYASTDNQSDRLLLFSARTENGSIVPSSISLDPASLPTFEVTMTNDAISRTLTNPIEFSNVVSEGKVGIIPLSSVPTNTLMEGFRQLIFCMLCDLDKDGDIDRNDVFSIFSVRNTSTGPDESRDMDGDMIITVNDARICAAQCTKQNCVP